MAWSPRNSITGPKAAGPRENQSNSKKQHTAVLLFAMKKLLGIFSFCDIMKRDMQTKENRMEFMPFVVKAGTQERISAKIEEMTKDDAKKTTSEPFWQTDWTSDYLSNPDFLTYALKIAETDELVGLAAYSLENEQMTVQIVYMESHPESNPTITKKKKYDGIGKVLIAYGIKLSIDSELLGDVFLEAKTSELEKHYVECYGAYPVARNPGGPARFAISDNEASAIFVTYLI